MLRFIVLGEIPGTQIYLSFPQVLLILGAFYGVVLLGYELRHQRPAGLKIEDVAL